MCLGLLESIQVDGIVGKHMLGKRHQISHWNYRHNRFNAIFQTAAEIVHHHKDFLHVLDSVKSPHLKLKAVKAELSGNNMPAT
jgi:hypothetical protein